MNESISNAAIELGERRIAELRAILAPLLAKPIHTTRLDDERCLFCGSESDTPGLIVHAPGCPVLRRDELLGRGGA